MDWGRGAASGIDDLLKRLNESDPKLQSLTILKFRRLNDADVEALAKALRSNSILFELNLCSHPLSVEAAAVLGTSLQHNSGLKRISIGNSSWGDQALSALAEGLKHNKVLEAWDLEHKGLTSEAAASISDVLLAHPALQQLVLSRNALRDAGLAQLCSGHWKNLSHLELADCGITAESLKSLAAAASLDKLQHLDLCHNDLGGAAAAEGLQQLVAGAGQLQSLKLRNTAIKGTGAAGVARGLPANSSLQHLDLVATELDDAGLAELAAALGGRQQQLSAAAGAPPPLQQLLLAGNPALSDAALSKLAAALTTPAPAAAAAAAADAASNSSGSSQDAVVAGSGVPSAAQQQQQQQWHLDLAETGAGSSAIEALSESDGLQQLSLFGCKLGAAAVEGADAPITTLQACLAKGGFARLQGLNLSGCSLSFDQLRSLLQQLTATNSTDGGQGLAAALKTLEVGANPGTQHDDFEGLVQQLREARPGLDVHWRVADSDAPPGSD